MEEIRKLTEDGFKVVVGAHPKRLISANDRDVLRDLLLHPGVVGLGEVGIDNTVQPNDFWFMQERQLKELLSYLNSSMVLVLHIRGTKRDPVGVEAYMRGLDILQSCKISSHQKVQLHCFSGTEEVIQYWLHAFPNTHFSVSGLVCPIQRQAPRAIPGDHLLVETDAPYFPLSSEYGCSTPRLLDINHGRKAC